VPGFGKAQGFFHNESPIHTRLSLFSSAFVSWYRNVLFALPPPLIFARKVSVLYGQTVGGIWEMQDVPLAMKWKS
jgi:hypothetical protein